MIKKSFCWHLCLLFLLKGIDGFGQPELVGKETHDITSSYSFDPGERIYVHTDKNFYLAGEIVWFKAYCIDNNRASGFSKIAYVEIMDRGNKPVLQAKIALDSNGGNGSFYLPLTLSSDHYTLRAYTNWMKNAGSASFFEKPISIVNTTRAPQVKSSQAAPGPYVDFFPEGGQLVEGIEGRVAFRIAGNNGIGLDAKGILVDNIGDTILQFAPYRFGIGQFTFTPAIGKNYKAIILLPGGKLFEQPLPVAEKNGYVMNVISEEGGRLKIKINARIQAAQNGETLLLLVHSRNGVRISREHNITYGSESVIYTDRSQLTPGINYITVFNKDKQPVCERLVFVRPTHSITAELNSDKTAYKTREAVGLVVSLPQTPVDIVNCSISVFQVDSLQDVNG